MRLADRLATVLQHEIWGQRRKRNMTRTLPVRLFSYSLDVSRNVRYSMRSSTCSINFSFLFYFEIKIESFIIITFAITYPSLLLSFIISIAHQLISQTFTYSIFFLFCQYSIKSDLLYLVLYFIILHYI